MRGTINADDKNEAIAQLMQSGLTALELTGGSADAEQALPFWQRDIGKADIHKVRLSKKKLLPILNQMSLMMKAGISLSLSMEVLIESQRDGNVREILKEINKELYTGTPLSEAMAKFRAFPEMVVSIVQAGEENGRLDTAFERCSTIIEKEVVITSKIRGATGYPLFLLILTLALMIIMNGFVLPSFAGIFEQFGADLPAITVMVMSVSGFLTTRWYVVVGIAALAAGAFLLAHRRSERFRLWLSKFILKFPGMGEVLRLSYISRFCRVMASLVDAGVSVVRALDLCRDIVTNRFMQLQMEKIAADVKVGITISAAMAPLPSFDSLLVSMVRVGEESGMLADSFQKMADLYEQQTDESTKRFTTMLEPVMTIIIAVIVATVVISIVVPMFQMYGVIGKS